MSTVTGAWQVIAVGDSASASATQVAPPSNETCQLPAPLTVAAAVGGPPDAGAFDLRTHEVMLRCAACSGGPVASPSDCDGLGPQVPAHAGDRLQLFVPGATAEADPKSIVPFRALLRRRAHLPGMDHALTPLGWKPSSTTSLFLPD